MNTAFRLITLTLLITSLVFVLAAPAFAADAKVAGEWNFNIESPNGPATPSAIFKQDGGTLTGTYKGRYGESPLKGTVNGNQIAFTFTINVQGQDLQIEYTGTVDGDSMKGTVKFGELGQGNFTGKKK
jgi:hypothetical protein